MKKIHFPPIIMTLIAVGLIIFGCQSDPSEQPAPPNILFIMADDLGYNDLGCYGQTKIKTPNIDQLASEGLRFSQFYAGATVCGPSRSVLMTGQHGGHTRVRGNTCPVGGTIGYKNGRQLRRMNLLEEDITVGNILQNAGYRSCLVGKWHIDGFNPDAGPLDRGFDEFYGRLTRTDSLHRPAYWPQKWFDNRELIDIPENQNGKKGYYRTEMNTDNAIKFMERNADHPFFLFLSYSNPHSPYDAPDLRAYEQQDWPTDEKTYASMIHYLDFSVGRVMQTLERLKLTKNTIVFFCSDNGPRSENRDTQPRVIDFFDSNGPLQGYKRDLYEGGIRVPMIVHWPGKVPKGKTSDIQWYFTDFLPTAAALTNTEPPENIDGIDMLPSLLEQNKRPADRFLYWEHFGRDFQQAVRWKQWKAIRLKPGEPLLLFDLSKDLGEENNVAEDYPEIIEDIEVYLKTARTESLNWPLTEGG